VTHITSGDQAHRVFRLLIESSISWQWKAKREQRQRVPKQIRIPIKSFQILTTLGLLLVVSHQWGQEYPPAHEIVEKSVQVTHEDWKRAPGFDFCELDQSGEGSKLYQVLMILGSPYNRLIAANGKKLSLEMQEKEREKLSAIAERRKRETAQEHQRRVTQYEKERQRDQLLLEELTAAMDFTLTSTDIVDSRKIYVVDANPKAGYVPKNIMTTVLSGMRGRLWVDQSSFRWVKVTAEVVRPVMIEGFVARVEPGTRFELREMRVNDQVETWLPSHFMMQSRARIFLFFPRSSNKDEKYFKYKPIGTLTAEECLQP
jgi:hypothetical protein